ncbi:urea transporter [Actinocorallia aurea]
MSTPHSGCHPKVEAGRPESTCPREGPRERSARPPRERRGGNPQRSCIDVFWFSFSGFPEISRHGRRSEVVPTNERGRPVTPARRRTPPRRRGLTRGAGSRWTTCSRFLRGIAQVDFQANPWTGLVFLVALFVGGWQFGVFGLHGRRDAHGAPAGRLLARQGGPGP